MAQKFKQSSQNIKVFADDSNWVIQSSMTYTQPETQHLMASLFKAQPDCMLTM